FTKSEEVRKLWHEVLGDAFLRRPRLSRIYYNRRFFYYPLRLVNALLGLGLWPAILVVASYVRWQLFPSRTEETFEQWVTNRFGRRLFRIFFETYTEKVWGISCSELSGEWAAQRIKDLSLKSAIVAMLMKPKKTIRTLSEEFHYPRLGPGMMWEAMSADLETRGGQVRVGTTVSRLRRDGQRITGVVATNGIEERLHDADHVISSMPVPELVQRLD